MQDAAIRGEVKPRAAAAQVDARAARAGDDAAPAFADVERRNGRGIAQPRVGELRVLHRVAVAEESEVPAKETPTEVPRNVLNEEVGRRIPSGEAQVPGRQLHFAAHPAGELLGRRVCAVGRHRAQIGHLAAGEGGRVEHAGVEEDRARDRGEPQRPAKHGGDFARCFNICELVEPRGAAAIPPDGRDTPPAAVRTLQRLQFALGLLPWGHGKRGLRLIESTERRNTARHQFAISGQWVRRPDQRVGLATERLTGTRCTRRRRIGGGRGWFRHGRKRSGRGAWGRGWSMYSGTDRSSRRRAANHGAAWSVGRGARRSVRRGSRCGCGSYARLRVLLSAGVGNIEGLARRRPRRLGHQRAALVLRQKLGRGVLRILPGGHDGVLGRGIALPGPGRARVRLMAANLGGLCGGDVGMRRNSLHGARVGDVARGGQNVRHLGQRQRRMRRAVA